MSNDYALYDNITPDKICRFNIVVRSPPKYNISLLKYKLRFVCCTLPERRHWPSAAKFHYIWTFNIHNIKLHYCGGSTGFGINSAQISQRILLLLRILRRRCRAMGRFRTPIYRYNNGPWVRGDSKCYGYYLSNNIIIR